MPSPAPSEPASRHSSSTASSQRRGPHIAAVCAIFLRLASRRRRASLLVPSLPAPADGAIQPHRPPSAALFKAHLVAMATGRQTEKPAECWLVSFDYKGYWGDAGGLDPVQTG